MISEPVDKRKEQTKLMPLFSKHLRKFRFIGFDIETQGKKNDFYMGGLYDEVENEYLSFYDKDEFLYHLMNTIKYREKCFIVATNLGFDFNGLFYNSKYWNEFKQIYSTSKCISIIHKKKTKHKGNKKLQFIDTLNYVQMGVEQMGELLQLPKLTQPKALGRIPLNEEERIELEIYNKRDCEISCKFMYFLQEGFNLLGGNCKLTIASTSMDIFRRKYLRFPIHKEKFLLQNEIINELIFKSYFGGRTEVFKRGYIISDKTKHYRCYDINSLYPFVMTTEYPNPNSCFYRNKLCDIDTILEYEGVSTVEIETPKYMKYPFLPFRDDKTNKLIFPLGKFKGTYTNVELRKALELGYKIIHISEQLFYKKTFFPFKQFITDMYNLRLKYKSENNPMELTVKIIMNSLYGKMGSRYMNDTKFFNTEHMTDEELIELHNLKDNENKNISIYQNDDVNGMIIEKKTCSSAFVFPILASYTTAKARIVLYDYISKHNAIYCDTDSIVTTDTIQESKKLGGMKCEYDILEGLIIKPKMYCYKTPTKEVLKLKGVPKTLLDNTTKKKRKINIDDIYIILQGGKIKYDKFAKLKESIRQNKLPNEVVQVEKQININDNKRNWNTPFSTSELQESAPLYI